MIKTITAINDRGESLVLTLKRPELSGYEVHDVKGLGPVKATINTSQVSTMDGDIYNSAHAAGRNIVLTLGLLPSPTVEEARQRSYQYFPLKRRVTLIIESDKRVATTYGYVESNEPPIFGRETDAQISILCMDSYLYDASSTGILRTAFYKVEPKFEFPFSNESLTQPLLEFGNYKTSGAQTINYSGDTEVGMVIRLESNGPVVNPIIYNEDTSESIRVNTTKLTTMTGSGILTGDLIVIDTRKGLKSVTLVRNGISTNIMNAIDRNADWLVLRKGPNRITYAATSGLDNIQLEIENQILYEGI